MARGTIYMISSLINVECPRGNSLKANRNTVNKRSGEEYWADEKTNIPYIR